MRDIKFRAWDTVEKCWQPNVFDGVSPEGRAFYISDSGTEYCDEYTLSQFTGLKDKNGVEIYEGDILSGVHVIRGIHGSPDEKEVFTGKVKYEPGYFYVDGNVSGHLATILQNAEVEVIGNIYEDKEVLK